MPVIEDAACSVGSEIQWDGRWEKIGRPHGDIACFSFHPRKVLTTGDGGMLTTKNPQYDRNFRLWRQHSMSVPDTARHGMKKVTFEAYVDLGYNYRMTRIFRPNRPSSTAASSGIGRETSYVGAALLKPFGHGAWRCPAGRARLGAQ